MDSTKRKTSSRQPPPSPSPANDCTTVSLRHRRRPTKGARENSGVATGRGTEEIADEKQGRSKAFSGNHLRPLLTRPGSAAAVIIDRNGTPNADGFLSPGLLDRSAHFLDNRSSVVHTYGALRFGAQSHAGV